MDVMVERCAGLDVHRDSVLATVRVPKHGGKGREQHRQRFGTMLSELDELGKWLASYRVTLVGMEATGVYWKPVFAALEDRFDCWLLNA